MEDIKLKVKKSWELIQYYRWIIDAYILDFFLEDYWNKLPTSWISYMESIDVIDFFNWASAKSSSKIITPLGLTAFKTCVSYYQLSRKPMLATEIQDALFQFLSASNVTFYSNELHQEKLLFKCIKRKKQHEIKILRQIVFLIRNALNCDTIIDLGSGLGHLSRLLTVNSDMKIICIEQATEMIETARKLDAKVRKDLEFQRRKPSNTVDLKYVDPVHLADTINLENEDQSLTKAISCLANVNNYGMLGLHSCGDLSCSLLRHFVRNSKVKYVVNAPCCYMRTCDYRPMSKYVRKYIDDSCWLTYEMLQTACHGLEMFGEELNGGNREKLKVHCYRAVLEWILSKRSDYSRHSRLVHVNKAHTMSFKEYASLATSKFDCPVSDEEVGFTEVREMLNGWEKVVYFYVLKLLLAPVVESLIIRDRISFLDEHGHRSLSLPVFDPLISPRNTVIVSVRNSEL